MIFSKINNEKFILNYLHFLDYQHKFSTQNNHKTYFYVNNKFIPLQKNVMFETKF